LPAHPTGKLYKRLLRDKYWNREGNCPGQPPDYARHGPLRPFRPGSLTVPPTSAEKGLDGRAVMANNEGDIEVIQNLLVFGVESEGEELRVDIYGGADCVCGTLIHRFADRAEHADRAEVLRRWCAERTPVTYVRRDRRAA